MSNREIIVSYYEDGVGVSKTIPESVIASLVQTELPQALVPVLFARLTDCMVERGRVKFLGWVRG